MKNGLKILAASGLLMMTTALTYTSHEDEAKAQGTTISEAAPSLKCPKCQNSMENGFLLDQQGYDAQYTNTQWVEGALTKKFVGGIKTKVRRPVLAFRCTSCGYLELYAK